MSRVAKKAAKHFALVAKLQKEGSVSSRRKLKEMRDVHYSTDQYHPSPGAAWQPDGSRLARGSQGRAKKLLSGYQAKQRQGLDIKR